MDNQSTLKEEEILFNSLILKGDKMVNLETTF